MHLRNTKWRTGGLDTETSSEMDQLLLDAKRLASRLREHNASSDALIGQANNLHFKVDAMKQVTVSKFGLELSLVFFNFITITVKFYLKIILLYTVID